jgi:hypothetical protein
MPLTSKGKKIKAAMAKQYGKKKASRFFMLLRTRALSRA